MKKVLYIYGYGSDKNSSTASTLGKLLKPHDIDIVTIEYNQQEPEEGLKTLEEFIEKNDIKGVIASSVGAFFALNLYNFVPMCLINPCFKPSVELPKLGFDGSKYKSLEDAMMKDFAEQPFPSNSISDITCFFGIRDEVFSYKNEMEKLFPFRMFNSGHRPNEEELKEIVPAISYRINNPIYNSII